MIRGLRPLLLPGIATLVAGTILIALGVWQLHRLTWKDALIARIEARSTAVAQPLPPLRNWAAMKSADYEFRHVALTGTFNNAEETLILRASDDGAVYHVLTPFVLSSGGSVLIDRGYVPTALKDRASRQAGELEGVVRITGLMRGPEPRNLFTPADDGAKNLFYTRDPKVIAAHWGLENAAPFSIDVDATMINPGGWPKPTTAFLDIPNNHFSYAMTWFGLALGLFGVFAVWAMKRLRGSERHPDPSYSQS